ncbi:MAG: hypothetical protein ACRDPT_01510 [Streptomycetales bacterium]
MGRQGRVFARGPASQTWAVDRFRREQPARSRVRDDPVVHYFEGAPGHDGTMEAQPGARG